MTESDCLSKMISPGMRRPGKYRDGIIQIMITRSCDKACSHCTQGSNLKGKNVYMTTDEFRLACRSLKGYFGVYGCFGGNPAIHPHFADICQVMREEVPFKQRGLWCNNPITVENARIMQATFDPSVSNINVHMDRKAWDMFKEGWPLNKRVFGLDQDSRHSPVFVSMEDVGVPEEKRWELISNCTINKNWSSLIGIVPGKGLRSFFCEIAYAQAALHADDPDWPDLGLDPTVNYDQHGRSGGKFKWWQLSMQSFKGQVQFHCHKCSVPLNGYGELACATGVKEQVSTTHASVIHPKKGKEVEIVTDLVQLGMGRIKRTTDYYPNGQL